MATIKAALALLLCLLLCDCGDNVAPDPGPDAMKPDDVRDACDPIVERTCARDAGAAPDAGPDAGGAP